MIEGTNKLDPDAPPMPKIDMPQTGIPFPTASFFGSDASTTNSKNSSYLRLAHSLIRCLRMRRVEAAASSETVSHLRALLGDISERF